MKITHLISSFKLVLTVFIAFGAISATLPSRTDAYDLIYTVQTGCYEDMGTAQQHYYALVTGLDKENLDFLRIEEIGRSYCVRIGQFKESDQAKKLHLSIKPRIASSMVMQAYVLDERVRKMFFYAQKADESVAEGPLSSGNQPGRTEQTIAGDGRREGQSGHEKKGDMYVKEKRLLSAAEEYRLAITDDPDNAELTWKLAELFYELQLPDDAFKFMQRAIGLSPGRAAPWRTKLGMLYYDRSRLDEAAEQFEMVLEMDPDAPDINYYLGKINLARNRLDNAREQFIEALITNPGSADIYYYLGRTYFQKKDYMMAWTAALTAKGLGYESEDLINELEKVSKKPAVPWDISGKELLIRHIMVQSRDRAEDIIFGLSQGERFESIVNNELSDTGKTLEYRDPSDIDPKIAEVARNLEIFANPVIVETQIGFYIVQRIPPITVYAHE